VREGPQKSSSRVSEGNLCRILQVNFGELAFHALRCIEALTRRVGRRVAVSYAAAVSYRVYDFANGIYYEFGIVVLNIVGAILRDDVLRIS
jgi:hypothetical protein